MFLRFFYSVVFYDEHARLYTFVAGLCPHSTIDVQC